MKGIIFYIIIVIVATILDHFLELMDRYDFYILVILVLQCIQMDAKR